MNIEKKQIKYNYSTRLESIKYIVIHDTGNQGKGANADAHFNYFNGGDRSSSANIFVDDSKALEIVDCRYAAWHCGDGNGIYGITNHNSIGIEICVNSDGDYNKAFKNAIDVTKQLMNKYGIPASNVVRHYDASRKMCPKILSDNNWSRWTEFKNKLVEVEKKKEELKVNWGKNLYNGNGLGYDASLRGRECYLREDADVYKDVETSVGKEITTLRAGQKLTIYSIYNKEGSVSFDSSQTGFTGYIRIAKVDIPYYAPDRNNINKKSVIDFIDKNIK